MGSQNIESSHKIESQREQYKMTESARKIDFGGLTIPLHIITTREKNKETATLSGALLNAFKKTFSDIGATHAKPWSFVDAAIRRAANANVTFSVDSVRAGDSFEIKDNFLFFTMKSGEKFRIPLFDRPLTEAEQQEQKEYTNKKSDISNKARREWKGVAERSEVDREIERILDRPRVDDLKILYTSMIARGIEFTPEERYRIWNEVQKSGSDYIATMKAHGDKRLGEALTKYPEMLQEKYQGTWLQHLIMVEYLRTYGLGALMAEVEATVKHEVETEVEAVRKQLGGMLSSLGYRGTPEKNAQLKSGEFSYTYRGKNLPPLRVNYTVFTGNENDTATVELIETNETLEGTFMGNIDRIGNNITARITEMLNEQRAEAKFTKRIKTFETALKSAKKRGLIEISTSEELPKGSFQFTIKDGENRYEVEVSTDRESENYSIISFNGYSTGFGIVPQPVCANFAECVKTAIAYGNEHPTMHAQTEEEKNAVDAEVEASTSRVSLVKKAGKIGTEISTNGDTWLRNVDTETEFGSQNVAIQVIEGKGLRLYCALPDRTKLDVVTVTTRDAMKTIKEAFSNISDFRQNVKKTLQDENLVPDGFYKVVGETTYGATPMFYIQSKDGKTSIMVSQYPQHETPLNPDHENRFILVKVTNGKPSEPKYGFSPEDLIKDALTSAPEK